MPVKSRAIPTLLRGISQSSDALKQPDHADIQDNADSNPVLGLTKRSGSQLLSYIGSVSLGNVHIQTINRDANEQYVAVFSNGNVRVFELDGTEKTVNKPDGTSYLNTSNPRSVMKTVTIADFTFVVNTSITTAMDTTLSPYTQDTIGGQTVSLEHQAIIFIKQATSKTTYSVTVDGVTVTDDTTGNDPLSTTTVANDLKGGLETGLSGFTVNQNGPVLWIRKNDGNDFSIDVSDSQGNTKMSMFKDSVQQFTDLPTVAPNGYVVEIVGDEGTGFDNYYVKFTTNNGNAFEEGQWSETVKAGIPFKFNYGTMPHVLIRQADGNFRFARVDGDNYGTSLQDAATYTSVTANNTVTITKTNHGFNTGDLVNVVKVSGTLNSGQFVITKVDNNNFTYTTATNEGANTNANCTIGIGYTLPQWAERIAGDTISAPDPSFIGQKINNVFFFRNRLGFLAGDNVILSTVSEFFNFFPETVISVLDTEPIDVSASHTKVAILKHAITMGEKLILFSEQTQFVLSSSADNLTPSTANVLVQTEFESNTAAQPVSSGSSIYFLTKKGAFGGIREYIIAGNQQIQDAANTTIHVPKLIPSGIFKMAASNNQDILILLGTENPNKLYVNRWLYGEGFSKALNAWFTYTLDSNRSILNIDFIGTDLIMVIEEANSVTLEKIPFETSFTEPNAEFEYHLDHKVTEAKLTKSGTYQQQAGSSTVVINSINHGLLTGNYIKFDFTSGNVVDGNFQVAKIDDNSFSFATTTNSTTVAFTGNVTFTGIAYNSSTDTTSFTLPYRLRKEMNIIGRYLASGETSTYVDTQGNTQTLKSGQVIKTTNLTNGNTNSITALGDYRNSKFIIGEPYEMHYRFSQQRLTQSGGSNELVSGRLQIHHFYIKYEDSGFFQVEVTPENRDTSLHKFTGRLLGAASASVGLINLDTGTFKVPVMSKSDRVDIDVKNNTFLPTLLASAEYEGVFHMRSRRV